MTLRVFVDWQRSSTSAAPTPPTNISGLALWWHANDLAKLADGAPVGIWTSRTGTSTATQATSAKQPAKQTVAGLPCVRFDGTDDALSLTGDALTVTKNVGGVTIFARLKNSSTSGTRNIFSASTGISLGVRTTLRSNVNALEMGGRRQDVDAQVSSNGGTIGTTSIRVHTAVFDYADSAIYGYLDGSPVVSNTSFQTDGVTSNTTSQGAMIGSQPDGTAQFLNGDLYELLVWGRELTETERATVETYLLAGGLLADDVTADVLRRNQMTVSYGRDQSTAVAPTVSGRGSFTLNNSSRRYSPRNTASPLYGKLKPARPVKIMRTVSGTEYVLFVGHTDDNPLNPDLNSEDVAVSLVDSLADFRGQTITTAVHQGIRTGTAIGLILDACGWSPEMRDLDAGATLIPYWWENGTDAGEALEKVLRSEGGPAFLSVAGDGSIMFRDRHHRLIRDESLTSQATWYSAGGGTPVMNGITYDDAWANIINTATVQVDERRTQDPTVVWTSDVDFNVAAGESTIITASGNDPVVRAITPVEGTDYTLLSGAVTMTLLRTSGASIPIVVTASSTAQIRGLQLRGQPITVTHSVEIEGVDGSSVTDYGQRALPHDLPWCNKYDAKAVVEAVIAERAHPRPLLTVRFMIGRDATRAAQLLSRNLADRVTVQVDELDLDDDFYIESITHELTGEHDHTIIFGLEMAPPEVTNPFRFGTAGATFGSGMFASAVTDPDTMFRFGVNTAGFLFGAGRFAR